MEHEYYYDQGVKLYDQGFFLKNKDDLHSIINALEHFIKANKMLEENDMLKPKTLCFIASCNYKIGNIDIAYRIAKKAKKSIPIVIRNIRYLSGVSGEMIGEKRIDELIGAIEENFQEALSDFDFENDSIDENNIDLKIVSKYI